MKNPSGEVIVVLREGASGVKIQYNLFCWYWGFQHFPFNNFFEKSNIFWKLFLFRLTIFEGGASGVEREYNFFLVVVWAGEGFVGVGNGVADTVFRLFLQKTPYRMTKTQKTGFGGTFFPYLWFFWVDCFQKQQPSPMSGPRTNHVNLGKIGSKCGFVIRVLQNEKDDHPDLTNSPHFELEGVRIVPEIW